MLRSAPVKFVLRLGWPMIGFAVLLAISALYMTCVMGAKTAYGSAAPSTEGVAQAIVAVIGALGLGTSGVGAVIMKKYMHGKPESAALHELDQAYGAFTIEPDNVAKQRRYMFALQDAAPQISGCTVGWNNGVLEIKYSGFSGSPVKSGA